MFSFLKPKEKLLSSKEKYNLADNEKFLFCLFDKVFYTSEDGIVKVKFVGKDK